jgi:hypothetical protein
MNLQDATRSRLIVESTTGKAEFRLASKALGSIASKAINET